MKLNNLDMGLLQSVAELRGIPTKGAINIRRDGEAVIRQSSPNIMISSALGNKPGLLVEIKEGTKNETVHVPVILTKSGLQDKVYNTFIVGENADVTIIAGCGIHNEGHGHSQHDGVHEIIVRRGGRLKYIEKHYGEGSGSGKKVLNPTAIITLEKDAYAELETVQIKGVDDTLRKTEAYVHENANLKIVERLLTQGEQRAESDIEIYIVGNGGAAQILSRAVAQENSLQVFRAALIGKTSCQGHIECDAILMDQARIKSIPELMAEDAEAVLTHEAAIGKIAGEQLIKLMSLGLTESEAVDAILEGFLR